MGSVHRNNILI